MHRREKSLCGGGEYELEGEPDDDNSEEYWRGTYYSGMEADVGSVVNLLQGCCSVWWMKLMLMMKGGSSRL